jgi:hypothetical protein
MVDCMAGVVGVTKNESLPYWGNLTTDFQDKLKLASSGLYLDQLPGGPDLTTIDDLKLMEHMLTQGQLAIDAANIVAKGDIIMKLNTLYKLGKKKFNGFIGRRDVSTNINVSGQLQGIRLRAREPIGGFINIAAINVCMNGAGTFKVRVAQANALNKMGTVINEYDVTSVAGNWTPVTLTGGPLLLPLEVLGLAQEYWIYWDKAETGNLLPRNNEIKCQCSNDAVSAAYDYVKIDGFAMSDITQLWNNVSYDYYAHGLSLSTTIYCDNLTIICKEFDNSEPIAISMAWAIAYKAAELWIEYLFKTNFVSREMVNSREYFWGKRNHFRAEYEARIQYIGNNLSLDDTNCYVCKGDKAFLTGIKV